MKKLSWFLFFLLTNKIKNDIMYLQKEKEKNQWHLTKQFSMEKNIENPIQAEKPLIRPAEIMVDASGVKKIANIKI